MSETELMQEILVKVCKICGVVKDVSEFSPSGRYADGRPRTHIYCKPCYRNWRKPRTDPVKENARTREYSRTHLHIAAAGMAKYRANNPEKAAEYARVWRASNPEKVAQHDRNKRAKRRVQMSGCVQSISSSEWQAVLSAHNNQCFWCGLGFSKMTQDHFDPLALGGAHTIENIVPACHACNSKKQATPPHEFAEAVGRPIAFKDPIKKSESAILAEILIAVTALPQSMFWRNNTGKLPSVGGRMISFGLVGSADIIGASRGRPIAIEVKTERGRQSEQQRRFQAAWERAGGRYVLARSVSDALAGIAA